MIVVVCRNLWKISLFFNQVFERAPRTLEWISWTSRRCETIKPWSRMDFFWDFRFEVAQSTFPSTLSALKFGIYRSVSFKSLIGCFWPPPTPPTHTSDSVTRCILYFSAFPAGDGSSLRRRLERTLCEWGKGMCWLYTKNRKSRAGSTRGRQRLGASRTRFQSAVPTIAAASWHFLTGIYFFLLTWQLKKRKEKKKCSNWGQ